MALIKCHECGTDVSTEAKTCPQCGATPKTKTNMLSAIGGVAIAGIALWFFFGGGMEQQAAKDMGKIEQQVAEDAVEQYGVVKRSGTPVDACVHAGLVTAAYVQAKDEDHYKMWKKTEHADCALAGMPTE